MPPLPDFRSLFGRPPAVSARAPGRVNLIGEHTDYNGGFVLPTTIPQSTIVELAVRTDTTAHVWSANVDAPMGAFVVGDERPLGGWLDYVQGITAALARAGVRVGGFDARIDSTVPVGSGLSSSAALEVSLLRALREAFSLRLDDVEIARFGQRAENDFVGAPVGIMDQMCSSVAVPGSALFLDTRSLRFEHVPLPANADLVVIDSGVTHSHASGEYKVRRRECEDAARLLGVSVLRDVGVAELGRIDRLPDPLRRRARHVVTENQRVLDAVVALRGGDLSTLGALFAASHASMRDDYEVSAPDVDRLVALASADPSIVGARLTGGGFGGAIVCLAHADTGAEAGRRITRSYDTPDGPRATVLVPATAAGDSR